MSKETIELMLATFKASLQTASTSLRTISDEANECAKTKQLLKLLERNSFRRLLHRSECLVRACEDWTILTYLLASLTIITNILAEIQIRIKRHRKKWLHEFRHLDLSVDEEILTREIIVFERILELAIRKETSKLSDTG